MATATSRVTRQHQISVPAQVRKRFGIRPGTVLEWHETGGQLVVRPRSVTLDDARAEIARMIGSGKRASLAELKKAKLAAALEKHARARR
jgi:AbrB family looped-hinge helix DNA binding protein